MQLSDGRLGLLEIREDAGAVLIEAPPAVGQAQTAGRPGEQLHPETFLERGDAPADDALADPEPVRSGGETARLDHGNEAFQLDEAMHIVALVGTIFSKNACLSHPTQPRYCGPSGNEAGRHRRNRT